MLDIKPVHYYRMLTVFSDPQRLQIIECLGEKSRNIRELASCLGKHMVKVSYHFSILRKVGLVKSNRMGWLTYHDLQWGMRVTGPTSQLDLHCGRLELSKTLKKCCS